MTNPYKIKERDEKFKTIQLTFSELDVKYREMINNSSKKTIITTSNRFDALLLVIILKSFHLNI